jgi:SAM-dependent methyltransferase
VLSWYREQLRAHGFRIATALLLRIIKARATTSLANRALPQRVVCPCCGWGGRKFYDYLEAGVTLRSVECPRCNSHPRHRLFALWLEREYGLPGRRGRALIFAPERALEHLWAAAPGLKVLKTDIEPSRGVGLLSDIQRLPFADDSFDIIWCQHVLTQVEDDRAAIRELRRVLRAGGGELVVSAGQTSGARTEEFGRADPRLMNFWRMYGEDFPDRLAEGGLSVRQAACDLSAADFRRYGVAEGEKFYVCVKPRPG